MSEESKVEGTVKAVTGLVKAVPVYKDALQPAAKEIGKSLQTVAKSVNVLLAPVAALVWGYDKITDYVNTRVTEKLANISPDQVRTPNPSVAGPALEALRYAGHNEELREMYASLLASAMDAATVEIAHPAFVEVICQLTSDEAKMLRFLGESPYLPPMIGVKEHVSAEGKVSFFTYAIQYFSLIRYLANCATPDLEPSFLVNLQRLGLVELLNERVADREVGVDVYEDLIKHSFITALCQKIEKKEGHSTEIIMSGVRLTAFGEQFYAACILNREKELSVVATSKLKLVASRRSKVRRTPK